jgi:general secretion pathway protein L
LADRLFIYLGDDLCWISTKGVERTAVQYGTLTEAAGHAPGRQVIVFVPGSEVLLTQTRIPTQNRRRLVAALPYALEDRLAEDVEELHCVAGLRHRTGEVHAAVVARKRMNAWLEALHDAGLHPDRLLPETLALPRQPDEWHILLKETGGVIRTGDQTGLTVDVSNLALMVKIALQEAGEHRPAHIRVSDFSGTDLAQRLHRELSTEEVKWLEEASHESPLNRLAEGFMDHEGIDLLQGAYRYTHQNGTLWRHWRLAGVLLALWLALEVGTAIADYVSLERQSKRLNAQIHALYLEAFPEARKVVNPRAQMEQGLRSLRASQTESGFLALLAKVAASLGPQGVALRSLSYRQGDLEIAMQAGDLQRVERIKQAMRQAGLGVEVLSVATRNQEVISRLHIRTGVSKPLQSAR